MPAREGHVMNHKRLYRLYREEKLTVRRRGRRKRALGTRTPMLVPHDRRVEACSGTRTSRLALAQLSYSVITNGACVPTGPKPAADPQRRPRGIIADPLRPAAPVQRPLPGALPPRGESRPAAPAF